MVKAQGIGLDDEPVLILGLSHTDVDALLGGKAITTSIRSRSGVEARVLLVGGETDEFIVGKLETQQDRVFNIRIEAPSA